MLKIATLLSLLIITNGCNMRESTPVSYEAIEAKLKLVDGIGTEGHTKYINNLEAFELLKKKANDSLNRFFLGRVMANFYSLNSSENLYISSNVLLKRSIACDDMVNIAISHQMLGRYFSDRFVIDSVYKHCFLARKFYDGCRQDIRRLDVEMDIANFQYSIGDYSSSEQTIFAVLKWRNKGLTNTLTYLAYNLLGIIYAELHDYVKSLEYHTKALEISKYKDSNDGFIANETSLCNIGNLYRYNGEYKKAIKYYQMALPLDTMKNYSNSDMLANLTDNIAYCRFKLGEIQGVGDLFYKALRIRDSLQMRPGIIVSKLHLSEYYKSKNDMRKAIFFADEARLMSIKNKLPLEHLASLKILINIDIENSVQHSQRYIKINDSLQLAERRNRNKFARIAFETDEITMEKESAVKQKWIFLAVAVGVLISGVLLFIIKYQRAKQKELLFIQRQQTADEAIYQLMHDRQIKIDEGRQQEKKRIARELHDGVMNRLTSTRLNLFILNKKKDDETIDKCLGFINDIQGIEKEIRQVAHDLDNDIFSGNNSFNTILESLFNEQKTISTSKIFTEIDPAINWETIEGVVKMNLYRIIQEVLQNCNKYAKAKNIYLNVSKGEHSIDFVVNDDGVGFDTKKKESGIGLKNIRDRVKILSGKIDISSRKQKGTTIIVNLPIKPNNLRQNGKKN